MTEKKSTMKLYFSPTSPYSRKVRVVARELQVELAEIVTSPTSWGTDYGEKNPINRVPALELSNGTVLFDSPVICEYLNAESEGTLLPPTGPDRWKVLRLQALADGLLDSATARRQEEARDSAQQSEDRLNLYRRSITQVLDRLEAEVDDIHGTNVGTIAVMCALLYLDFRFPHEAWRSERSALAGQFALETRRESYITTVFQSA